MPSKRVAATLKAVSTGLAAVDALSLNAAPTIHDYVTAVSEYVLNSKGLTRGQAKTAQIALGGGLARAVKTALEAKLPPHASLHAGERTVAGALRTAQADVSESHHLDGLRLAVEIKPINLAVGRAIWNRFGDVRVFAVNIHLKFPFAVVGGVLAIPTWEWAAMTQKEMRRLADEAAAAESDLPDPEVPPDAYEIAAVEAAEAAELDDDLVLVELTNAAGDLVKKPTTHLIERAVRRLERARVRITEDDSPHLLEAIAVVVYDPDAGTLDPDLPPRGSALRWDAFIDALAEAYDLRFED